MIEVGERQNCLLINTEAGLKVGSMSHAVAAVRQGWKW